MHTLVRVGVLADQKEKGSSGGAGADGLRGGGAGLGMPKKSSSVGEYGMRGSGETSDPGKKNTRYALEIQKSKRETSAEPSR